MTALDPATAWSQTDHLLAAVYDAVQAGNWQRGGGQGAQPEPIPRPGVATRTESDEAERAKHRAYFEARRARAGKG